LAAPTNTLISNNAVGNRESLHNIIGILNKDETPFVSTISSGTADATYEEWQLDALGNADTNNSNLEGDDTTAAAITPTTRVGNRTQILKKPFTISNTQEAVKKANQERQLALKSDTEKLLKMAVELKAYVDKTNENMLSLDVIKKAEEIEKLAHSVREKMKGPN